MELPVSFLFLKNISGIAAFVLDFEKNSEIACFTLVDGTDSRGRSTSGGKQHRGPMSTRRAADWAC